MPEFYEIEGSPIEKYTLNAVFAERTIRCAWKDRYEVAQYLAINPYPYRGGMTVDPLIIIVPEDDMFPPNNAILTIRYKVTRNAEANQRKEADRQGTPPVEEG